jgi:MFS transporter, FHS family, glucose/mannose:H+ symporter
MSSPSRSLPVLPFYLGIAATGVGVALPGIILPSLLTRLHLQDDQAGLFLLLAWLGSSVGALLVRGPLRLILTLGSLLIAASSIGLSDLPAAFLKLLFLLFGLGLGITMTTISVLCQQNVDSKNVSLIRLNLAWAVGAFFCPPLALRAIANGDPKPLLIAFGLCFAVFSLWAIRALPADLRLNKQSPHSASRQSVPLYLVLLTFLVSGVEAAIGGWLTTFTDRIHLGLTVTIAAPTCLWAGLLLSRFLWALPGIKITSQHLLRGSLWLIAASSLLLIASTSGLGILSAAFGIGFGAGPVYPLLLALALDFKESGGIFFIAGLGSACIPWLTGIISHERASLRMGLIAPTAAALLMLLLALLFPLERRAAAAHREEHLTSQT